jgi:ankyrin repeat protein
LYRVAGCLIRGGARIDQDFGDGVTILHLAAFCDSQKVAEVLLRGHANVNVRDHGGRTPYTYALRAGNLRLCVLLKEHGGMQ